MMTTIFEHDGKELYRDEAGEFGTSEEGIEAIRRHYAQFDKRLLSATYTVFRPEKKDENEGEDEPTRVVFAKKVGQKGGDRVIVLIVGTPPTSMEALGLLSYLLANAGQITAEEIMARSDEITGAYKSLDGLAERSRQAVRRCLKMQAVPVQADIWF